MVGVPSGDAGLRVDEVAMPRPMRPALAKMAAAVRAVIGIVSVVSAVLGIQPPVTWAWLIPALAAVVGWTVLYVVVAWTRGLPGWLVMVDLCVASALFVAIGHLVAPSAVMGTDNWVSNIASMAVVTAQLAGLPAVSAPGVLLVVGSALAGSRLAHSADGGVQAVILITGQGVVAAAVMAAAMRIERSAAQAFNDLQTAEANASVALARAAEERAQWRHVHNGPLTVLSMADDAMARVSEHLRQRAAAVLQDLPKLIGGADGRDVPVRLDERLAQIVRWYEPPLKIARDLRPCSVPERAADALAGAVGEALENVRRHSGVIRASIELRDDQDAVRVTVTDQGRGFDVAVVSSSSFGLREGIAGLMAAVGGTATVRSGPGAGTVVELVWRHG